MDCRSSWESHVHETPSLDSLKSIHRYLGMPSVLSTASFIASISIAFLG